MFSFHTCMSSLSLVSSLALVLILFPSTSLCENWAVLIAGSNSFYNYRHQSDVCHAYQILTQKGGIPPSNIIVFMFDDIAHNSENPFPGQIFNKPNGTNVYKGVQIDYSGSSVNKTTFLKVLRGDKSAGGKVVGSSQDDDVFIYYSDHGATGLVCMPSGDDLHADELLSALRYMNSHKMYRRLVFYLEACESGSMFSGVLPSNMSIFATSAANSDESSYAYYFWKPVGTYLGDEYSIRWMEDSDMNWSKHESLLTQFVHVRNQVKESHPQMFGSMRFVTESIADFEGRKEFASKSRGSESSSRARSSGDSVSSRDVKLSYLLHKYAVSSGAKKSYYHGLVEAEISYRQSVKHHVTQIVRNVLEASNSMVTVDAFMAHYKAPRNFDCLRSVKEDFNRLCEPLSEYGLTYVKNLVQLCETFDVKVIREEVRRVCRK